jgi:hypothetical protein
MTSAPPWALEDQLLAVFAGMLPDCLGARRDVEEGVREADD